MRYAVPVTDGKLAAHFGHCQHFAIIDVDETVKAIVKKELLAAPEHEPGLLPRWLAEQGVTAVLAGGMGMRAQAIFSENRILVVVGAQGNDPEQVVLDYLRGTLAIGENVCDH